MSRQQPLSTGARLNLGLLRLTRNWLKIVLVLLGLYATLPFVAPTLMVLGLEGPARTIYNLYTPMCHRMAFRSLFLYGDQPAYPLSATGSGLASFESYVGRSRIIGEMSAGVLPMPPFNVRGLPEFVSIEIGDDVTPIPGNNASALNFARLQLAAGAFLGTPEMGYKTALCARDVAIYGVMFLVGLVYSVPVVRRRLRPIPLWLFFILGVAPIGIDGFSQLLGYPPFSLWEPRETLPEFRVLTGALFGAATGWLAFPYLDLTMKETGDAIREKFRKANFPLERYL